MSDFGVIPDWARASSDPDVQLLASCPVGSGHRVLIAQMASPALLADVAGRAASVSVVHRRWSAARELDDVAKRYANVSVRDEAFPRPEDTFDAALVGITPGRALARAVLVTALRSVRPGGWVYASGANRAGARTALADASLLGAAETVASKGGHRLFRVARSGEVPRIPDDWGTPWEPRRMTIGVRGRDYTVWTQPGVFSFEHLDDGAAYLLDHYPELRPPPGARVLDACCGYGILGLVATQEWQPASVAYADDDLLAIACARATAPGSEVHAADLTLMVPGRDLDVIACNPPFHQGHATDKTFVARFAPPAARALRRGGRLVLVANAFLPYRDVLRAHFAEVTQVARDGRFQILVARL